MRRLSQLTRVKIDQDQVSVNILYNERKRFFPQYKSFCYAWHRLIDDIFLSIFGWCDIYQIFVAETDVDIFSDILIDIFKMHLNLKTTPLTFLEKSQAQSWTLWWQKEDGTGGVCWRKRTETETLLRRPALTLTCTRPRAINNPPPPEEKNFLDDFNHSK